MLLIIDEKCTFFKNEIYVVRGWVLMFFMVPRQQYIYKHKMSLLGWLLYDFDLDACDNLKSLTTHICSPKLVHACNAT
jgi:hypothetical protein